MDTALRSNTFVTALYWIRIAPAAVAGWVLGFLIGLIVFSIGEAQCPPEFMGWKGCFSPDFERWDIAAAVSGSTVASFLFVLFAALLAPAYRRLVSMIAAALQVWMVLHLHDYLPPNWLTDVLPFLTGGLLAVGLAQWICGRTAPPAGIRN